MPCQLTAPAQLFTRLPASSLHLPPQLPTFQLEGESISSDPAPSWLPAPPHKTPGQALGKHPPGGPWSTHLHFSDQHPRPISSRPSAAVCPTCLQLSLLPYTCCPPHCSLSIDWPYMCSPCFDPLPPAATLGWCPTLDQNQSAVDTLDTQLTSWVCQPATKMDMRLEGCKGKLENMCYPCLDPSRGHTCIQLSLQGGVPLWTRTCYGHTIVIGSTSWVCHAATEMDGNVHPTVH